MSDNTDDFFDNIGGSGAPSLKIQGVNDGAIGVIVDQFKTEAKEFGKDVVKRDAKTGQPIMQLVVVLETEYRNWDRVAKIPLIDKDDKSKGTKPASEDDGRRALYIEPWTNLHAAVGKAVVEGTGQKGGLKNGATLGVKIVGTRDTGKGNELRLFEAKYTPPAAGSDFFAGAQDQGGSSSSSASAPASEPAPSAPAPSQDPWASENQGAGAPPF